MYLRKRISTDYSERTSVSVKYHNTSVIQQAIDQHDNMHVLIRAILGMHMQKIAFTRVDTCVHGSMRVRVSMLEFRATHIVVNTP